MGLKVIEFEDTPNPNAVKCVLSGVISERPRSYRTAASAQGDSLAEALFAISGVTCVLICNDFVTVNKTPDAEWKAIRKAVRKLIESK